MKKIEIIFFITAIFIIGCANSTGGSSSDNGDNNTQTSLWQNSENGVYEEILLVPIENGEELIYIRAEEETEEFFGFIVSKQQINNNPIYGVCISADRQATVLTEDYWTNYNISCGQNNVTITEIEREINEDGVFNILGFISNADLNLLKNATSLQISLTNPSYTGRNVTFTCNNEFIGIVNQYF